MWRELLRTPNSAPLAVVRLGLGTVMFAHGAQKMLGWWGGAGFNGTVNFFGSLGIPSALALLAIAAEFFGGLGLILGFLTRIAAFGVLSNMTVAVAMIHAKNGLFMNWMGNKTGEGFEFHLLAIAMSLAVIIGGAGAFSIDHVLSHAPVHRTRLA
jgi:putative oxidoreductase